MELVRECLGILKDKMSVFVNKYGNILVVLIFLSIDQELKNGKFKDDDIIVFVGFGGGLIWGVMIIKWGK